MKAKIFNLRVARMSFVIQVICGSFDLGLGTYDATVSNSAGYFFILWGLMLWSLAWFFSRFRIRYWKRELRDAKIKAAHLEIYGNEQGIHSV